MIIPASFLSPERKNSNKRHKADLSSRNFIKQSKQVHILKKRREWAVLLETRSNQAVSAGRVFQSRLKSLPEYCIKIDLVIYSFMLYNISPCAHELT